MEEKVLKVNEKQLHLLARLLSDHLYWGWIYQDGEWRVSASGVVEPELRKLYAEVSRVLRVLKAEKELAKQASRETA